MILVDIGNSGLRAVRVVDHEEVEPDRVVRLSWSARIGLQVKAVPEQFSAPNQRWCDVHDASAFDWMLRQLQSECQDQWLISSVHQRACELLQRRLREHDSQAAVQIVAWSDLPVHPNVDFREKTGIDRLLAGFAAWQEIRHRWKAPSPVIVVQAGTAVTVDFMDSQGVFQGGAIMPGLGLSLQLLAAGTDKLPWLANHMVDELPMIPGKNTDEAIAAGVYASLVGGVQYAVGRYREQFGESIPAVVSGGDGHLLRRQIGPNVLWIDHLVLQGLRLIGNPT